MSNYIALGVSQILVYATLVSVTIVHTPLACGQDPDIKKQLQGVDLEGVQKLRLSPNGELAAGLTKLYANPGYGTGSFSLVKVWSVKEKQLLQQFRIPGEVYEAVFSPDGSILVSADKTGNLGSATTIRAWNLLDGSEHKGGGRFPGLSNKFCFSPDGNRLAAIQFPEYSWLNPLGEYAFKLNVWQVTKSGVQSINIPNALGDQRATIPSGKIDGVALSEERGRKILARVTPVLRGFSQDGKQLICDFDAGPRAFDARTGRIMQRPKICTVGLFKSMLMIAPQQVPADAKSLTIEITPREKPFRLERAADGWWGLRKAKRSEFRVSDKHFVLREGDVETKQEIRMLLGLKDDSSLADLSSLKHPVGIIKIDRDATRLKFRLEEVTDGTESGETLQTGEVRWAPTISESKNEEADHASALLDIRAIIEAGRDSKSMPAGMVVRLYTDAIGADEDENTKERWEFSAGKVHRLVINDSKGSAPYRREKTLAFDTTNICRQLLDGKLFVIASGEGTGKARMFAGTAFEGAVGERAIEILIDGEPAVEVGESCLFAGLSKTDALAFHALYEQLAEQARNAFSMTGVPKNTKNEAK